MREKERLTRINQRRVCRPLWTVELLPVLLLPALFDVIRYLLLGLPAPRLGALQPLNPRHAARKGLPLKQGG
jgi:hypothetical protein